MRVLVGLLLLVAALLTAAPGRSGADEIARFDEGRLWRVERPGIPPSHVLGTIHSTDAAVLALSPAIRRVFDAAGTLAVEIVQSDETMLKAMRAMMLGDGQRLDAMLTPDEVPQLERAAVKFEIPLPVLLQLQPWAASAMFSFPPVELRRQRAGVQALDFMLVEEARRAGKSVVALETDEEQLAAIGGGSREDQLTILRLTLAAIDDIETEFAALKSAYLGGHLGELRQAMLDAFEGADADVLQRYEKTLVWDRNQRMVERMAGLLAQGNALIAVGALHLPGEQGILNLLQDLGYTLSPVE